MFHKVNLKIFNIVTVSKNKKEAGSEQLLKSLIAIFHHIFKRASKFLQLQGFLDFLI
jgi:hypothetical protein